MKGLTGTVVLEPADGSLGPLLRVTDDRLAAGVGYGRHAHRAVDVVAVVLSGSLRHRWVDGDVLLHAGDVGILCAGAGLEHDEVAGDDGARVLQCHLRGARPADPAAYEVVRRPSGWVELGRPDARLWLGSPADPAPEGLRLGVTADGVLVDDAASAQAVVVREVVWELDRSRPAWAGDRG